MDVRLGDVDDLTTVLTGLAGSYGPQRHLFEPVLAELVGLVVRGLEHRARPGCGVFVADVVNGDDEAVSIDDVPPALRALLRAVLASLNAAPGDTHFHLGLVAADPDPLARIDVAMHALMWADVLSADLD
ncbi:hypothetical protein JHE00_19335 [Prauserella sp. ASG 168]|uniref:Uncharacterized protein n=2 Tax=Prauserella cavernicola TaxID=2800127 RepID=A0A934QQR9_9PSEU|nr:hypothetical protein [Prauserella cavernicola]